MLGVYYLHVNGDLIFKHGEVDLSELMESDFVKKFWVIPITSPTETASGDVKWILSFLKEAVDSSSDKERTKKRALEILQMNEMLIPDNFR